MNKWNDLFSHLSLIEKKLGYVFQDKKLLLRAFVHRSFFNEHKEFLSEHNERLEFLGDSVLGLVVADYLYATLPSYSEGQLSLLRSSLVDTPACFRYLKNLELGQWILVGKGEKQSGERGKETIGADAFEAIVGAIYLDGGFEAARKFILQILEGQLEELLAEPPRNFKAQLQDIAQKKWQLKPIYQVIQETGPEHCKLFYVEVQCQGTVVGKGKGFSKKEAEQEAAADALMQWEGLDE